MSMDYLLFQLYGPMAAWGDVAMGEVRSTYDRPSKSAVLGMIAAALGLRQSDEEKHRTLAESYRFAVRLDVSGQLLRDYHTSEVPTGKRARGLPTRRDELDYPKTSTIESYRDYRCDARATVCVWTEEDAPHWPLSEFKEALEAPRFVLYLGRKACPPALPLAPTVVTADTLRGAFASTDYGDDPFTDALMGEEETVRIYWEEGSNTGFDADQVHARRDQPVSRARWQFEEREERYTALSSNDEAAS